ncbi:hypothetical protein R6G86_00075 [Actinotignum urinale]|uniref:Uncharacterized protein n=1 Tax=Actinotignum urinale TaxID=190146 RepID=A0ABU5G669_9ACTO|nr:hypothetical protein [Actinotignum urinale]
MQARTVREAIGFLRPLKELAAGGVWISGGGVFATPTQGTALRAC